MEDVPFYQNRQRVITDHIPMSSINTCAATSNEWMQFYEQTVHELSASSLGFSDATVVATTSVSSYSNLSPTETDHQLTPKASSSTSRPIRRRSRASKKTPTTLLNANASNFRALVQRFTGCPSTASSLGNRRGPINLNFSVGSGRNNQSGSANSMLSSASGNDYYNHHQQSHQQENASHWHQHQQLMYQQEQQQQHGVSFDNTIHGIHGNDDQIILDGFDFDSVSLQELNRDLSYSNEN